MVDGGWWCVVSGALLCYFVGWAILGALGVIALVAPINAVAVRRFDVLQAELMNAGEERVKRIGEILQGILVIKLFSWEESVKQKVGDIRTKELNLLWRFSMYLAALFFLYYGASSMIAAAVFSVYSLINDALDPSIVFPALQVIVTAAWVMFDLPASVASISKGLASVTRVVEFLNRQEVCVLELEDAAATVFTGGTHSSSNDDDDDDDDDQDFRSIALEPLSSSLPDNVAIRINNGTFQWPSGEQPALSNIDLTVLKGELLMVIGQVGSGKSSLLAAILGEIPSVLHDGSKAYTRRSVEIAGAISYVPQEAWIRNQTVKNNIVLPGATLDERKYRNAIKACALSSDLKILPAGDQTEIGERGINLSGGQKQRINIARALYAARDIVLLDDPLSAVDAHVGKHLFRHCISNGMKGKTRVLVTHQLQFLSMADRIVIMANGAISNIGTYNELVTQQGVNFASLMHEIRDSIDGSGSLRDSLVSSLDREQLTVGAAAAFDLIDDPNGSKVAQQLGNNNNNKTDEGGNDDDDGGSGEAVDVSKGVLMSEEERDTGAISWSVYYQYLVFAGGTTLFLVLLAFVIGSEGSLVVQSLWLTRWSSNFELYSVSTALAVYLGIGLMYGLMVSLRQCLWGFLSWNASKHMHHAMLSSVMASPLSFFQTTPHGRILNRFSKDQASIDTSVPERLADFTVCAFSTIGKLVLVVVSFVFLLLVSVVFYAVIHFFRYSARELKRLSSIANSPIYAHFDETLDGLETIRAYGIQHQMTRDSNYRIEQYGRAFYCALMADNWLLGCVALISSSTLMAIVCLAAYGSYTGAMTAGLLGLAMTSASSYTGTLTWVVRTSTSMEAEMGKVERLLNYSNLPHEAAHQVLKPPPPPPTNWPTSGQILFTNVVMSYRPNLPPVLNNISMQINPQEKVGIVGRTGAGKSVCFKLLCQRDRQRDRERECVCVCVCVCVCDARIDSLPCVTCFRV
jgi:ATP-binding cassette, subfamily C (CFTR/MRP), member 1